MKAWSCQDDWQTHKRNLLQLWMARVDDATGVKNIGTSHINGGWFRCDDWPLQETLPMKQHRKLLGWDEETIGWIGWSHEAQPPKIESYTGPRVMAELSNFHVSKISFGWKWNKFLLWGRLGEIWDQNVDISNQHGHSVAFCGCKFLSNKVKRVSTEYSISCFFLPAQSWQLKAFSVG